MHRDLNTSAGSGDTSDLPLKIKKVVAVVVGMGVLQGGSLCGFAGFFYCGGCYCGAGGCTDDTI